MVGKYLNAGTTMTSRASYSSRLKNMAYPQLYMLATEL
jgi:hypothetical protein